VVVVDVLRFTTAVEVAVSAGVAVVPARWRDDQAAELARSLRATLADGTSPDRASLSPASLAALPAGTVAVLPSPNGATCALEAAACGATVIAACLRNAAAVAAWLSTVAPPIGVVACGERWPAGALRPSLEDLLGAGAVVSGLPGRRSPEAEAAARLWSGFSPADLHPLLLETASGRELAEKGWTADVAVAAAAGVSTTVPTLTGDRFLPAERR